MNRIRIFTLAGIAVAALGATALTVPSFANERGGRAAMHHGGGMGGMHHRGGHRRDGHRGAGRMMEMLATFDANDDGKLTQEEINSGREAQLKKFDADGDGSLSLEEYQALWLDAMRERMVDRFQNHDDDGDGKVTVEEFGEHFSSMVERMDRNEDGVLDREDHRRRMNRGDRDRGDNHDRGRAGDRNQDDDSEGNGDSDG